MEESPYVELKAKDIEIHGDRQTVSINTSFDRMLLFYDEFELLMDLGIAFAQELEERERDARA